MPAPARRRAARAGAGVHGSARRHRRGPLTEAAGQGGEAEALPGQHAHVVGAGGPVEAPHLGSVKQRGRAARGHHRCCARQVKHVGVGNAGALGHRALLGQRRQLSVDQAAPAAHLRAAAGKQASRQCNAPPGGCCRGSDARGAAPSACAHQLDGGGDGAALHLVNSLRRPQRAVAAPGTGSPVVRCALVKGLPQQRAVLHAAGGHAGGAHAGRIARGGEENDLPACGAKQQPECMR